MIDMNCTEVERALSLSVHSRHTQACVNDTNDWIQKMDLNCHGVRAAEELVSLSKA